MQSYLFPVLLEARAARHYRVSRVKTATLVLGGHFLGWKGMYFALSNLPRMVHYFFNPNTHDATGCMARLLEEKISLTMTGGKLSRKSRKGKRSAYGSSRVGRRHKLQNGWQDRSPRLAESAQSVAAARRRGWCLVSQVNPALLLARRARRRISLRELLRCKQRVNGTNSLSLQVLQDAAFWLPCTQQRTKNTGLKTSPNNRVKKLMNRYWTTGVETHLADMDQVRHHHKTKVFNSRPKRLEIFSSRQRPRT